jgi:hypothetical protein
MGRSNRTLSWFFVCMAIAVPLAVVACGGGATPDPTVTVQGTVVGIAGLPLAGVVVRSQGRPPTVTAADGSFTLAGLTTPYAVSLSSDAPDPWVQVFDGLTTTEPWLMPDLSVVLELLQRPGVYQRTNVHGPVPTAINPIPAGERLIVCVEGRDFDVFGCDKVEAGDATYAFTAFWAVPGPAPVRLHALRVRLDASDRPTGYLGYGYADLTLNANVGAMQTAPSGDAIFGLNLQATVGAAGGGTLQGAMVLARVGPRLAIPVYLGPVAGGSLEIVVPTFAVGDSAVLAIASFPSGNSFAWQVGPVAEGYAVVVPAPPQLLAPPDAATGVTTATAFEVIGGPGAARTFRWTPASTTDGPLVALSTADASVTIPDPATVGLPLPLDGAYTWTVVGTAAVDADALAKPEAGEIVNTLVAFDVGGGGPGLTRDGAYVTRTPGRTFTLAP